MLSFNSESFVYLYNNGINVDKDINSFLKNIKKSKEVLNIIRINNG